MPANGPVMRYSATNRPSTMASASRFCPRLGERLVRTKCCSWGSTVFRLAGIASSIELEAARCAAGQQRFAADGNPAVLRWRTAHRVADRREQLVAAKGLGEPAGRTGHAREGLQSFRITGDEDDG